MRRRKEPPSKIQSYRHKFPRLEPRYLPTSSTSLQFSNSQISRRNRTLTVTFEGEVSKFKKELFSLVETFHVVSYVRVLYPPPQDYEHEVS